MSGFIAMDRGALEHPLLKDAEKFRAWFWLVARARWQAAPFDVGGKIITLDRGQLSYSMRELAEQWGWSKSSVDRFVKRLEAEGMVNLTRAKTGTARGTSSGTDRLIITICNYAKYQDFEADGGTARGTPAGTDVGQQRDIKEQRNKGTSIPSPIGDGRGEPAPMALDLAASLFRTGLSILTDAGHEERPARSIIGKWKKSYSESVVLAVLARCQVQRPENPVEWITRGLQSEAERAAGKVSYHQGAANERPSTSEIGLEAARRRRARRMEREHGQLEQAGPQQKRIAGGE